MSGQDPLTTLFRAIVSIYFEEVTDQNLQHVHTTIEDNLILLLIESLEYNELWESGQYRTGIMRAASFYQSFLIDECDLESDIGLYDAIRSAAAEGFLSEDEERVLQFLREVRNDCGHNTWLRNEYHEETIMLACFAALTVTDSIRGGIVDNQLTELGESPMERNSPSNLTTIIQNVEERYNWEWDEDQRRYDPIHWSPSENEEPFFRD